MEYKLCESTRCSSSRVTSLISTAIKHSDMSVHDSITLMVRCMLVFFPLFVSWLFLDSQTAMNRNHPGF